MGYSKEDIRGKFEVVQSFAIRAKKQFYLFGNLVEGEVQKDWFANVPISTSLSLCVHIEDLADIELTSDHRKYKLLIVSCEDENWMDMLIAHEVGSELLDITEKGE